MKIKLNKIKVRRSTKLYGRLGGYHSEKRYSRKTKYPHQRNS